MVPLSVLQCLVLSRHSVPMHRMELTLRNHCLAARERHCGPTEVGELPHGVTMKMQRPLRLCVLSPGCVTTCSRVLGSQQQIDSAALTSQPISCAKGAGPGPTPTLP